MNKINNLKLMVSLFITILFFPSCSKEDTNLIEGIHVTQISNDVSNLFITKGNLNSDTVLIFEQGGPSGKLRDSELENFPNKANYLRVYTHQVLTYNNGLYEKELTKEQAEKESLVNNEILHRVIKHFKVKGKKVFVIGHSYGAFVIAHYLSNRGSSAADKFVMMGGRLNIEEILYKGLLNKVYYEYPDGITPVKSETQPNGDIKKENELILAGAILQNRYTDMLRDIDLTNVIYAFANDDEAVGGLTSEEKAFLTSKNVTLFEMKGGHSAMFDAPNNKNIYNEMIK